MVLSWFHRLFSRPHLAVKIGYSYAIAMGVAICGTVLGLAIGDHRETQAYSQLELADKQQHLLSDLEKAVLEVQMHPQRLATVLGDSIWFEYETNRFRNDIKELHQLAAEINTFARDRDSNLAINDAEFAELAQAYQIATDEYQQFARSLWYDLNPEQIATTDIPAAQQRLFEATRSDTAIQLDIEFDRLSERLAPIVKAAQQQQIKADLALTEAKILRRQIIGSSMALSVAIAAIIAYYLARGLVRPLEQVTQIAVRVTQEENFNLQIPVTTRDELGSLATSLNQLIQWTGQYTQELKQARNTLELRVTERTHELSQALQDLQNTQSQLIHTEKMSSLGQLVAGIAHEINNPVNFIYGNLTHACEYSHELLNLIKTYQTEVKTPSVTLQQQIENSDLDFLIEDFPKLLRSMQIGAERIREIVKSLRTFSRLDEAEVKEVNLHDGIDSTLMLLQNRLKAKGERPEIQVIKDYANLPVIQCYSGQLNQVFMNILANAIDALEDAWQKTPANCKSVAHPLKSAFADSKNKCTEIQGNGYNSHRLQVCNKPFEPTIWIRTETIGDRRVAIHFKDNGSGMNAETQQRLFDPFFTTKQVGKGTGLGLSIGYQIVTEKHGGKLYCTSVLTEGSEFVIEIPIDQL
jgi:two-component system NtrC family sensor kinase